MWQSYGYSCPRSLTLKKIPGNDILVDRGDLLAKAKIVEQFAHLKKICKN